MLKSYPEQALAFAQGGVIAPSALGRAARADQLETVARRRAAGMLDDVPAQVAQATAQARLDGFRQGYAEAFGVAVPALAAALADVQALRQAVLGQIRTVITASLDAEGIDAALVVRRCEQALGVPDTELVLYVPDDTPGLGSAVLDQLARQSPTTTVRILTTRASLPLLKVGPLLFELDPAGALTAAVESGVDADALDAAARHRAQAYLAAVDSRLKTLPFPADPTGAE